jgi:tetratricopeptide (TPR) repeat protein
VALDPYQSCPCGSGKKLKWCSPRVIEEADKALALVSGGQIEAGLHQFDRLVKAHPEPSCLNMYLQTQRAICQARANPELDILAELARIAGEADEYALPHVLAAEVYAQNSAWEEVVEAGRKGLARCPTEAADVRVELLTVLAAAFDACHMPIAGWAAGMQGKKLKPSAEAFDQVVNAIQANPLLPNFIRHGLRFQSPDELEIFNEDRRTAWDKATAGERHWRLEEVERAFRELVADDSRDAAAWYNLGVARAWLGDNAGAVEAFERRLKLEVDDEEAAKIAEIMLVLQWATTMEDSSDFSLRQASYHIDLRAFADRTKEFKRLARVKGPQPGVELFFVLDQDVGQQVDPMLVGPTPSSIAMLLVTPQACALRSTLPEWYAEAKELLERQFADAIQLEEETVVVAPPEVWLHELVGIVVPRGGESPDAARERRVAAYFEEAWINKPLRMLENTSPIDASASKTLRRRLEAVVRDLERRMKAFDVGYNFDRVRNKLGLMSLIPEGTRKEDTPLDVSAFSAAQLADLDASKIDDDALLTAYRSANGMDLPTTALKFAAEMSARPSVAAKVEMVPVFRRLVLDRLERRKNAEAVTLVDAALHYDAEHYGGRNAAEILTLKARCLSAEGKKKEAADAYRELLKSHPKEIRSAAEAVEGAMRDGDWRLAKELAEVGLARAQETRQRDFQEQFREYLQEATARAR